MAIVNIKGTVTRTFYEGRGAEVTETFKKRDGSEGKTRWACWFQDGHGLSEGELVSVSGLHGDQVDDWTDKQGEVRHSVKRSVNSARVTTESGTGGRTRQSEAVAESWATDTRSDGATQQTGLQGNWSSSEQTPF